jgi:lysophospholipase L1-like esterase
MKSLNLARRLLALLLLLAFPALAADSQPRVRRVLAIGDSITFGWGTSGVAQAYPEKLEALLNARDTSAQWVVFNRGVSGEGTTGMLARWNTGTTNASGLYQDEGPLKSTYTWAYVVILIGVNDVANDATAAATFANIKSLADDAQTRGAKVVLCSVAPWKGFAALWNSSRQAQQDALAGLLQAYATAAPSTRTYVDVFTALEDPGAPDYLLPGYDSGDGIHPNTAGLAAIAAAVLTGIPSP